VSFLLKWLGFERAPQAFDVRPSRTIVLELSAEAAFDVVLRALDAAVGAQIESADRERGTIDATFGLIFSERIACSLRSLAPGSTEVVLESRRRAAARPTTDRDVLDRLTEYLTRDAAREEERNREQLQRDGENDEPDERTIQQ